MSDISDLPPRTWRGWWLAWPKWFRIGCWAGLGVLLLHVVLAVRMVVGLQEGKEVVALRNRGAFILYSWEDKWDRRRWRPWYELAMAGLLGRSGNNVRYISLDDATGDDVQHIGRNFAYIKELSLYYADLTAEDLPMLSRCRHLSILHLTHVNIDDESLRCLSELRHLKDLWLEGTLVTDASIKTFKEMRSLEFVDLSDTNVSVAAIQGWTDVSIAGLRDWQTGQTNRLPKVRKWDFDSERVRCLFCWADGRGSPIFIGPITTRSGFTAGSGTLPIGAHEFEAAKNRHIRLTVRIGDCESEPVELPVRNGGPAVHRVRVKMPMTREQAIEIQKQWEQQQEEEYRTKRKELPEPETLEIE